MSSSNEDDREQCETGALTVHDSLDRPLHFRVKENGRYVMIGQCCTIIDVHIDEKVMDHMMKGGRLDGKDHEGKRILTFNWENPEFEQSILSKVRLDVIDAFDGFYKDLCDGFVGNNFKLTRDFVHQLYQSYRVCLTGIVFQCIVFEIVHMNELSVQKMESEKDQVLQMCEEFLQRCSQRDIKINLTFESATEISTYDSDTQAVILAGNGAQHGGHAQHSNLAGSKRGLQRLKEMAQVQAATREKIMNISESLKHILPQTQIETREHQSEGTVITPTQASKAVTGDSREKGRAIPLVPSRTLCATAAHVKIQHVQNPFQQSVDSSSTTAPSLALQECSPTDNIVTDLKKYLKSGIVVNDEEITTHGDLGLSTPAKTSGGKTVGMGTTQAESKKILRGPIEQLSPKEAASPQAVKSSHEADNSDGGAKPKVRGESSEEILEMVRSVRGKKSDHGFKRISESVAAALIDDVPVPPRAESLNTVLCLDCSESMTGEAFDQMKMAAEEFVDGLDDTAGKYGLEENVAVVCMSGRARVVQHLTNDYSVVRDAIDSLQPRGKSPIFEAVTVSLAAIQGKGGSISVSGVRRVPPRIIFITDGKVTDENHDSGADYISDSSKMMLLRLASELAARKHASTCYPITWIPVGHAEKELLNSLAKLGHGHLVEMQDVQKLVRFYRIQDSIGKIYAQFQDKSDNPPNLQEKVETFTRALASNSLPEDIDEIVAKVVEMLTKTVDSVDDFDNVYENPALLPLGTRVKRNPECVGEHHDLDSLGTIINHDENENWVWVLWDKGNLNRYCYNEKSACDVLAVDGPQPILESPDVLKVGVQVAKDSSLTKGNHERGMIGVVIRIRGRSHVKVRWENRTISVHALEGGKLKDLMLCEPRKAVKDQPASERKDMSKHEQQDIKGNIVWRWKDDINQWHLYSREIQLKLNQEYQRRPEGTCLVMKSLGSFRIFFKSMCEKSLESSIRHEVERISVDDEELANLTAAESYM